MGYYSSIMSASESNMTVSIICNWGDGDERNPYNLLSKGPGELKKMIRTHIPLTRAKAAL
jgi:hypothetical protein